MKRCPTIGPPGRAGALANGLWRWFPRAPEPSEWGDRLESYYRECVAYHDMTRSGDKSDHPQALLLSCLVRPGARYAEVGCGGGQVCRMVAQHGASVRGFDLSPIAVANTLEACRGLDVSAECAHAGGLPLADNSVDGCYSFEVLEHLWDPAAAVKEMVRVTRPGGFVLLSCPLRFSLDLHLRKGRAARTLDFLCASWRRALDTWTRASFVLLCPDLSGKVYPDCDMVAAIVPANLARAMARLGCRVEFWDTTYMCAMRESARTTLDFQRNTGRPLRRHYGDHLVLLAYKGPT